MCDVSRLPIRRATGSLRKSCALEPSFFSSRTLFFIFFLHVFLGSAHKIPFPSVGSGRPFAHLGVGCRFLLFFPPLGRKSTWNRFSNLPVEHSSCCASPSSEEDELLLKKERTFLSPTVHAETRMRHHFRVQQWPLDCLGIWQRCCASCWCVFRESNLPLPGGHGKVYANWRMKPAAMRDLFGAEFAALLVPLLKPAQFDGQTGLLYLKALKVFLFLGALKAE